MAHQAADTPQEIEHLKTLSMLHEHVDQDVQRSCFSRPGKIKDYTPKDSKPMELSVSKNLNQDNAIADSSFEAMLKKKDLKIYLLSWLWQVGLLPKNCWHE